MTVRQQFRVWRRLQWEASMSTGFELDALGRAIDRREYELAQQVVAWLLYDQPYRWDQIQRNVNVLWGITK